MSLDEENVAHPHLFGAPAYARPRSAVAPTPLPPDPDDLPLAVAQTDDEHRLAETLLMMPYQTLSPIRRTREEPPVEPRPFLLRGIAGRILRRAS